MGADHFNSGLSPEFLKKLTKWVSIFAVLGLVGYFLPYLLLGKDAHVLIFDNLDDEIPRLMWISLPEYAYNFWEDPTIPFVANGVPRSTFRSGLNVTVVLFQLFDDPFIAYTLNWILVHIIGFISMYLLLRYHFLKEEKQRFLVWGGAFLWGVVSYYHSQYGLSIAGQPLMLYVFLNLLRNESDWKDWTLLVLFPFYSFYPATLLWWYPALLVIWGIDWYKKKRPNWKFMGGLFTLGAINLFVENQMLRAMYITKSFVSHREDYHWENIYHGDIKHFLLRLWANLISTHYHPGLMWTGLVIAVIVLVIIIRKKIPREMKFPLFFLIFLIFMNPFGIDVLRSHLSDEVKLIRMLTIRFFFLMPFMWTLLFMIALPHIWEWLSQRLKNPKLVVGILLALILGQSFLTVSKDKEFIWNVYQLVGGNIYQPNYREYLAEKQFKQIEEYIGRPKSEYRVISIGMSPTIAQMNWFYTLDGNLNNYPIEYKAKWRKVIEKELEVIDKDCEAEVCNGFDIWGNRFFTYVADIGYEIIIPKEDNVKIENCRLNLDALRELGGEYIISAVEILNWEEAGLKLEKKFSEPDAYNDLWLYSVPK